jgi:hypothetical protein
MEDNFRKHPRKTDQIVAEGTHLAEEEGQRQDTVNMATNFRAPQETNFLFS